MSSFKVNLDQKQLEKNQNQEMLQKVRKTAKWSQLYKSGSTIPHKQKAFFIYKDEEQNEKKKQDDETLAATNTNEHQAKL